MAVTAAEQEAIEGIVDRSIMPIVNKEKRRVVQAIARALDDMALHLNDKRSPGLRYAAHVLIHEVLPEMDR